MTKYAKNTNTDKKATYKKTGTKFAIHSQTHTNMTIRIYIKTNKNATITPDTKNNLILHTSDTLIQLIKNKQPLPHNTVIQFKDAEVTIYINQ